MCAGCAAVLIKTEDGLEDNIYNMADHGSLVFFSSL